MTETLSAILESANARKLYDIVERDERTSRRDYRVRVYVAGRSKLIAITEGPGGLEVWTPLTSDNTWKGTHAAVAAYLGVPVPETDPHTGEMKEGEP